MTGPSALALALTLAGPSAPSKDPAGTVGGGDPVTKGSTDLDGVGAFGASAERDGEAAKDATVLQLSAGAILNTGNARALAATGATKFRLRRKVHEFGAGLAGNYAQAAADNDSPVERTVGNVQGRVRYDYFFAKRWSVFLMATGRHDPFQGLDARINVDPGVAFYAIDEKKHRLWFETGYDFQFDVRTDDARIIRDDDEMPTGVVLAPTRINHAARLFAGYSNHLSEAVTFDTGVEYLQSFLAVRRWRVNWEAGVTASLGKRFALATSFTMRVDNDALPDVKKIDTVTAISLVVSLL